jgi:serralysin
MLQVHARRGERNTVLINPASFTLPGNVESLIITGSGAFSGNGNSLANTLEGGTGNDTLSGLGSADRIDGGAGNGNDRLTGGDAADTFVFKPGFGNDVVTDFRATGFAHDIIELDHSMFAQFATVQQLLASALVTQVGADVVITADADDIITCRTSRSPRCGRTPTTSASHEAPTMTGQRIGAEED